MDYPKRRYRVPVLLVAWACTASAFGGIPDQVAAQATPRAVAADLFNNALRDTLDTPPPGPPRSRNAIRSGTAILFAATCGLLLVLVGRRRGPAGRGARAASRPSPPKGARTSALRTPSKPRSSTPRAKAPIDLPPHVVDFLRRNAQRRSEALQRGAVADQEESVPLGHDDASSPPARPRVDIQLPGYGSDGGGS